MKNVVNTLLLAVTLCLLAFPMTACPDPPDPGGDVDTFVLPDGIELDMVNLLGGRFMMGSTNGSFDEEPVHQVTLTQDFQIGKFEITKAQWEAVMGTTPWAGVSYVLDDPNSPAVWVSWNDVQTFITALNNHTGETFRLPTEAEWEYACRAGSTTEYSFGDSASNLGDYAWYRTNAGGAGQQYAHIVGGKLPNAWGLYDMHGNAWEWCQDWYGSSNYSSSPGSDPTGPPSGSYRVLRGGSFFLYVDYGCRSAYRYGIYPNGSNGDIGFRVVRSVSSR